MVSGAASVKRTVQGAVSTAWLTTDPSARMPLSSELKGSMEDTVDVLLCFRAFLPWIIYVVAAVLNSFIQPTETSRETP
ncbi:hypothetical protein GCM10010266_65500 [Streptomyces griseomycini]|nr:hypothetical protein GCM10010266_65500 [Streptomyces griseomycini]